jgi:hypothetical protein
MSERACLFCGFIHDGASPCGTGRAPEPERVEAEYVPPPRRPCNCALCTRARRAFDRGGAGRMAVIRVWLS